MSFEQLLRDVPRYSRNRTRLEAYHQGAKRLDALGVSLPPEVRVLEIVANWPRLVVESVEERLDVEGFRLAGQDGTDETLWGWWQARNLDNESSMGHTEALVQGRACTIVGPPASGDAPAITVHSTKGMAVHVDPLTGEPTEAVRLYRDIDETDSAAHYLPDRTQYYHRGSGGWVAGATVVHRLGMVPVTPIVNRGRLDDRFGETEMTDVISLTDACARTLTNLQVSQELVSLPQKWVMGATAADFVDKNGQVVPRWQAYIGHMLAIGNKDAKAGQFAGADLRNFSEVVNLYARLVGALSGLPPHFLGFSSDNPSSAEAIKSSETRLVKRAERKQRAFGQGWERTMQVAMRLGGLGGGERLETVWRNPATPTDAAKADAAVKLVQAGILPVDMALEMMGFTSEQRRRAAELRTDPMLAAVGL
ncbi:phage portal protein [Nocardia terpenica]|uniref:phage portal protein n=1 Tax=Nocardia terpenica TaxID=455432 RepID=UPI001893CE0C|nr:phage portal protein [Nocardia terpenica]MBF6063025.1 phage portal protein [Nocardia terpenica]MBF6104840.1 phage portal protein [Nocardia terpenica]MBF6112723.1 phage portal protein [Nocardia terpenica]MBF6118568.1 phage portal protein [Nocardia terpenica]MBF6155047.1 phage portal protein [Nocardia terpenica]